MPIKPPDLDDRRYDDLVREARALIPQYCPEWTNLSDADPGMTLVQLFAWMTEMTIFRLNRVPDKTYVHFLNFIGEERRPARPATVPVTFTVRVDGRESVEVDAFTRVSTKQAGGTEAIHFVTNDRLTVHDCRVQRVVAVRAGPTPMVRELRAEAQGELEQVLQFGGGRGVQVFRMDPTADGPHAYTPYQFLYLAHDDFRLMDFELEEGRSAGRVRLRTANDDELPIAGLFVWQRFTADGWVDMVVEPEPEPVLGMVDVGLAAHLPDQHEVDHFGQQDDPFPIPAVLDKERHWIRGRVDYERWLALRMQEDLEITWRDDRGGEERLITNWDVRATGRHVEFFVQDMPPIRAGWTVRLTLVDRGMPAGRNAYFPRYRFSFRVGEEWEAVPPERVRYQGTSMVLTGPFTDMATDGYNLRAERIEAVYLRAMMPDLEVAATWMRPVDVHLAYGPETGAAGVIEPASLPRMPFQPAVTLPPLMGMKLFVGSDLLDNRAKRPVLVELELSFEVDGEPVEEPADAYHMQLTYRAADTWRVLALDEQEFSKFTFADVDPDGALQPTRRRIRFLIDPAKHLKGLFRSVIGGVETTWLRFELTRAQLTLQTEPDKPPMPVAMVVHAVRMGVDGVLGKGAFEQPMPGLKTAMVEVREHNRRMSRAIVRSAGRLSEHHPFDTFIDIRDDVGDEAEPTEHTALYLKLDKPLPAGARHAMVFKCRGEAYLPMGVQVTWEQLEQAGPGRLGWRRLVDDDDSYKLDRSGVLEFAYPEVVTHPEEAGVWLRALFRTPPGKELPALPPLSHLMLNTVEAVNLHEFRMEKFSGVGTPHQTIKLRRSPLYVHSDDDMTAIFPHPDRFGDIRVMVTEDDGERREWRRAPGNSMLTATKDDRVFVIDPVEGTLTFGNGIRGRMLPVGNYNVSIERYHVVPGEAGNVGPWRVEVAEGLADVVSVANALPGNGGRNAESIDEIIRRAPSVLTSRDRAVTRLDFEIIAQEASGEVARAACDGAMTDDGEVEVVILPMRRQGEILPDPFLSTGLKEHVQNYLARRCLVNIQPQVRLATFQPIDVAVTVRLRPNANVLVVRDDAQRWVRRFLDPYEGGLDGAGWPFKGTLFSQDFGRMVSDLGEVRHVAEVQVFAIDPDDDDPTPGWERGEGGHTQVLDEHDLFVPRKVRVITEESLA
ncbi:MAG: baseplate J/gp47 family protein [Myxococcales bacterium]|nr:baseplate J/gp47 family protein [Myxococcales bacterium]